MGLVTDLPISPYRHLLLSAYADLVLPSDGPEPSQHRKNSVWLCQCCLGFGSLSASGAPPNLTQVAPLKPTGALKVCEQLPVDKNRSCEHVLIMDSSPQRSSCALRSAPRNESPERGMVHKHNSIGLHFVVGGIDPGNCTPPPGPLPSADAGEGARGRGTVARINSTYDKV